VIRRIDRYLLARVCWPLLGAVAIALAALLLERLIRLLDLLANKGGPLGLIVEMLGNLVPHYLELALPVALFIGTLYAAMRFSHDNELDAMRSAGLSLGRLIRPIMIVTVGLALFCFYILGYLEPYTRYGYRALLYLVTETAWDTALERGSFFTGFDGKTILIGNISNGGKLLSRIFVDEGGGGTNQITITARQGSLQRDPENYTLHLLLRDGVRLETSTTYDHSPAHFDELDIPLFTHTPEPFRERGGRETELDYGELLKAYRDHDPLISRKALKAELHGRITRALSVLFLPLLAAPIGISSRRTARSLRVLVGLVLLIGYYQLLGFGENLVVDGRTNAFVAIWLPFAILALGSSWLFFLTSSRPGQDSFGILFDTLDRVVRKIRRWLFRETRPA
jgi:lipopolysaccharide export system permease protein